jgi:uncharacterized repeat protein (TIGR01451 family)
VIVTDTLPLSVTLVSSSTSQADGPIEFTNPNLLRWPIGDITSKEGVWLHITVTLNLDTAGQSITNTGTITGDNIVDPVPPVVCLDGSPEPCVPVVPTTTLKLIITEPVSGTTTPAFTTTVLGLTDPGNVVTVTLNTSETIYTATVDSSGHFTVANVVLAMGSNMITAIGVDAFGNSGRDSVVITSLTGCVPDLYEEDDDAARAQIFNLALSNTHTITQNHDFHVQSDQDWIKLLVRPGAQYEFATSNLGPLADTKLILYATDGETVLAQNDDAQTNVQYSRILWTAPLTPLNQTVHLVALQTPFNVPSCNTDYTLSLAQTIGGDLDNSEKRVTSSPVELAIGDPLTYTITVINSDPLFSAAPVTVTDTLPPTITLARVDICEMSGQIEQYQLVTNTASFTWVGAIDANAQVNLCVRGTVAVTPWASINTAWIRWNGQVISRSTESFNPAPPDDNGIFLPIIFKND